MHSRFGHGLLVIAVGLWAARCGGSNPQVSGSVATAPDAGAANSGVPSTDAGAPADAGTAGNTDAGIGGGSTDAGISPDAGTGTGGVGTDGGTGIGGGSADAGASDAGTTASDDCDGLRPPFDPGSASGSHFIPVHTSSGNDGCAAGVSSGTGTLALVMISDHFGTLDFVSTSGTLLATTTSYPSSMAGGERGFIADQRLSETEFLQAWSDSGAMLARTPGQIQAGNAADDPLGGVVALTSSSQITSYAPSLAVRWSVTRPSDYPVAMAVDRAGATLFLFDGTAYFGANTVAGIWIDPAGAAGNIFEMLGPQSDLAFRLPFALTQRTASGLFLSRSGQWVAQIDSLATVSSAAPEWLQARPSSRLHMVHGGKGYAVLPVGGLDVQDCAQTVEVVSPSGLSCGTTTFRAAAGACRTGPISVGYDGSVMQVAPDPDPAHKEWFGPATCYWQWWTGFFR